MKNPWLAIGAVNGFLAVAAGAFGAHGLASTLPPTLLEVYKTGASYHLVHAVALCIVALAGPPGAALPRAAAFAFLTGIVLFSGSLYALAVTGARGWGAVTPLGGLSFLAGWVLLAAWAVRGAPPDRDGKP